MISLRMINPRARIRREEDTKRTMRDMPIPPASSHHHDRTIGSALRTCLLRPTAACTLWSPLILPRYPAPLPVPSVQCRRSSVWIILVAVWTNEISAKYSLHREFGGFNTGNTNSKYILIQTSTVRTIPSGIACKRWRVVCMEMYPNPCLA